MPSMMILLVNKPVKVESFLKWPDYLGAFHPPNPQIYFSKSRTKLKKGELTVMCSIFFLL